MSGATLEEVTWRTDELEVTALPGLGCRLHRLRAFGVDVLRTPESPAGHVDEPFSWGAYVMAPWTNRADPSPMTIAGRRIDLAPNFPDGTAIHAADANGMPVNEQAPVLQEQETAPAQ